MSNSATSDRKVTISYQPLYELLRAIVNGGPQLREIQALTGSSVEKLTGDKTCLSKVLDEFEAELLRINGEQTEQAAPEIEPEQQAAPTDGQPISNECIVPFVFDAVNDQETQLPQYKGGLFSDFCLSFNIDIDLRTWLTEHMKKSTTYCDVADNGYFDDLLEVTGILIHASTNGEDIPIKLAMPKGKRVGTFNDQESPAFNVTISHMGRLFSLQSFFGFDPKTGILRAVEAGVQTDVSLERLATSLGIDDVIKRIRPVGYYIRGIYHAERITQI